MADLDLKLPPAHYRCTSCGDCCHGWEVPLLPGEGERFQRQVAELIAPSQLTARLVHTQRVDGELRDSLVGRGGTCVALTDDQMCRVHARFGAEQKPRACQLYPFRFMQTPTGLRVGLSFSCPAVVDGEGPLLAEQRDEIAALFQSAVRGTTMLMSIEPDQIGLTSERKIAWSDAENLLDAIAAAFSAPGTIAARLCSAGSTAALVSSALDDGATFSAALESATSERDQLVKEALAAPPAVDRLSRGLFRTLVKASELGRTSSLGRLGKTVGAWLGKGEVAVGAPGQPLRSVGWSQAEKVPSGIDAAGEALLARWLGVTLWSGLYFGPAGFGLSIAGGLDLLALSTAVALFLARARAAAEGHASMEASDVRSGIRQVEAGVLHRSNLPAGFARALDATASLDLLREQLEKIA